jgi:hypothetical protein
LAGIHHHISIVFFTKKLKEVLGIIYTPEDQSVWAVEDSSTGALYKLTLPKLQKQYP